MNVALPIASIVLLVDVVTMFAAGQNASAVLHLAALAGVLGALEYVWVGKR